MASYNFVFCQFAHEIVENVQLDGWMSTKDVTHPNPFPHHAIVQAKEEVKKIIENNPKTATGSLMRGNDTRKQMSQVDPAFTNPDYLNHAKLQQCKNVYNKVQGHSKAFDTLGTSFESTHQLCEELSWKCRRHVSTCRHDADNVG
jgi:hypothetical protein